MMRKIYLYILLVIFFLGITTLKVGAMQIPNTSEIRFFNLVWVEEASWGDTTEYSLRVELEPGLYENINNVIINELGTLKLYGVLVFQYPRSINTPLDERSVFYQENVDSEYYNFYNVEFIAVKKMSNRLELYLSDGGINHSIDYFPGLSNLGGIRVTYYIPDLTYDDGYVDGYDVGFSEGLETGKTLADEWEYTRGYNSGYSVGYDDGYDKGISENMETGGFGLILKNVFLGVGSFLGIQLLPGISIGAIIAVPIVFGIITFILGRRKE